MIKTIAALALVTLLNSAAFGQARKPMPIKAGKPLPKLVVNSKPVVQPKPGVLTTAELLQRLHDKGCDLIELKQSAGATLELTRQAGVEHADAVAFYKPAPDVKGGLVVAQCRGSASVQHIIDRRMPGDCEYIAINNILIVGACPPEVWAKFSDSFTLEGAKKGRTPARPQVDFNRRELDDAVIRVQVDTLRNQLELYKVRHKGAGAELVVRQWTPLVSEGYLKSPPKNPLCPATSATTVVAGTTGIGVDPAKAGWVYDASNGMIYAAGSDD
jgi:hypothetical protein